MVEQKQIEEMARMMCIPAWHKEGCERCSFRGACSRMLSAEKIYNAGYRKQSEGEWVKVMNHRECSKCGYNAPYKKIKAGYHLLDLTNFCQNCGAKMRKEDD